MAMVFVIFFFFHCDFRMSSWDYFIATAVLYTLCWLYAQCRTYFEHGIRHKARLSPESDEMLKISIDTNPNMEWGPGQHIFLRFFTCGVHALTAHPFTICSVPQLGKRNQLVFYVKRRGGLTSRLMALAQKNPDAQIPVLLDGPYGGVNTPDGGTSGFDTSLIIGGGAGAGLTLSFVEDFIRFAPFQQSAMRVIVATRDPGLRVWYIQALEDIAARHSQQKAISGLSIHIHETFTGGGAGLESDSNEVLEAGKSQNVQSRECKALTAEIFGLQFFTGRPNLLSITPQTAEREGVSVGVVVCGPSSMTHDVSEAASLVQSKILAKKPGFARELWLHTENFSYVYPIPICLVWLLLTLILQVLNQASFALHTSVGLACTYLHRSVSFMIRSQAMNDAYLLLLYS